MVPEHGVHPGATEVLPSLEMFDPSKYGLPAYDDEDSVLQDDDKSPVAVASSESPDSSIADGWNNYIFSEMEWENE